MGVGRVVEKGSTVSEWNLGDEVIAVNADVRETNVCDTGGSVFPLGNLDPKAPLILEPGYVAVHSIRESNVRFGDSVAVFGLGAIGLLAVRMAVLSGADQVFAIDMIEKRRNLALEYGAAGVFDPRDGDVAKMIHDLTGKKGVDVAIEVSGSYKALAEAIRSTCICGTVCSTGFYQNTAEDIWLGREWHHNRLTMVVPHGCGWGHVSRDYPRWTEKRAYASMIELLRKGRFDAPGLIDPYGEFYEGPEIISRIKETPEEVVKFGIHF